MNGRRRKSALDIPKTIVLVGLMGAGKSHVGRQLASRLGLPFVDADSEVEAAAGRSIQEIFEAHGEAAFRDGERRVIIRLLDGPTGVLAAGGGAFMVPETRAAIQARGISIWLRAELDLLLRRVSRRNDRPLLQTGDPREILRRLIDERHPIYGSADITVDAIDGPASATVDRMIEALEQHLETPE